MIDIELFKKHLTTYEMNGWLEDWDLNNIAKYISQLEPGQLYLEVGVARGVSSTLANVVAKDGVRLKGIDIINWADRDFKMQEILKVYGKDLKNWEFIEEDSQLAAKYWKHGKIDLLFIDGDHTYEGLLKDFISWYPWVKEGGVIMFDDYNNVTGVKKAINDVIKDHHFYRQFEVDGEMFILKK